MPENQGPEEKKLIIDEDWKSQVEAEKSARPEETAPEATGTEATGPGATGTDALPQDANDPQMPPASFEMLVSTLASEAMVALGQIPHPATNQAEVRPNQAKYFIDTLEILLQKVEGNIADDEKQAIESLLHQLRMAFVAIGNKE